MSDVNMDQQQEIETLKSQLSELKTMLTLMGTALSHPTPTTTTTSLPPSSRGIKVATPDPFDGTLSNTEAFINQLLLYFNGRKLEMKDDSDKITFTLSYMRGGTAGPWAVQKVKQLTTEVQTWDSFLAELKSTFGDPNPSATARFRMDQLRQGSMTAEELVAKFKALTSDSGYNDAALMDRFEKCLNSALVDSIYKLPVMPITFEEWVQWAVRLDRQWRQREASKRTSGTTQKLVKPSTLSSTQPAPVHSPNPTLPSSGGTMPVAMDVDSNRKKSQVMCFKCHKPGHIARNCRASIDINAMSYDALKEHFEGLLKDKEEKKQDF